MSSRRSTRFTALMATVLACPALALSATTVSATSAAEPMSPPEAAAAPAPEVPAGFQDTVAIGNLSEPTAVAFAADGTAFVAMKSGEIRSFDYNSATEQFEALGTSTLVADLSRVVHNFHDRGLTGIAVDPQLGAGSNFVYVNYAYNRDPRDNPAIVPKWYTDHPSAPYDDCPAWASMGPPPVTGCVVDIRVSRIPIVKQAAGWVGNGAEQPLIEDACMQFSSHASGDVAFGPDGHLYASAGDGASYDTEDWGQANNPCGDPPDQGGSLRSQDIRTSDDPLGLSGATFRINKATGAAHNGSMNNADRIVTYGQRNPWRLAFRPGTSELWSGDVGNNGWEELNRVVVSPVGAHVNLGWPCYEGSSTGSLKQAGWDSLDKPMCETLYAAGPSAVRAPYFSYQTRGPLLASGENCQQGTSAISGIAFVPSASDYPAEYRGSMFFNDYARGCIWRLGKLGNGDPDPSTVIPFVEAAEVPVGIEVGPGGDLFYVDYGIVDGVPTPGAGDIHRVVYTPSNQAPVAALTASAPYGPNLLSVDFDARGSTDADGDPLTYEWALDGDGVFNDGSGPTATTTKTYSSAGPRTVQVRVRDSKGAFDTEQVQVTPGNTAPTLTSVSPSSSLTWAVGDTVSFSATATDSQQSLTDSAFSWSLVIEHCPSVCHSHPVTTWGGQRTGSFLTPDHEYPSNLLLQVTVTDAQGASDVETVKLDPKSVAMTFASNPTGAALTVAGNGVVAPHNKTFIQGSNFNVSAPASQVIGGQTYLFSSWSDGGARSHAVKAPSSPTTLTANYVVHAPVAVIAPANPSGPAPFTANLNANGSSDSSGHELTYAWDLDNDGAFDDATGPTASRTYPVGSHTVRLRATDSIGATNVAQTTVTSTNQPPVAVISPANPSGPAPFTANLNANGSSDPNGHALTFAWDLDNDGAFDDATGATASRTYQVGTHTVRLQARDSIGATHVATTTVTSGNTAPVLGPVTPADGTRWSVGETVAFSATATDAQDGNLPASAFTWKLAKVECASGCSPVEVTTFEDVSSGSFVAPDLAFPSHLLLTVRVVDSGGASATKTVRLDPRTVVLTFTSTPTGLSMPPARTVVVGSRQTISALERQQVGNRLYQFYSWSDGGAATHVVTAPATDHTYNATYKRVKSRVTFRTRSQGLQVNVNSRRRIDGWSKAFPVGSRVKVTAPEQQWRDGVLHEFVRWSDGRARSHSIRVPEGGMRIRAIYRAV